jgi:surface protein
MIEAKETLTGNIISNQSIGGSLGVGVAKVYPPLEDITIIPATEQQVFTHENSYGYDNVTVDAIPSEYIIPNGTKDIDSNGIHNISEYEKVNVNIEIPEGYIKPEGTLNITENGTKDVTKYSSVDVNVEYTPNLQDKEVTPTKETQNITSDANYDGLNQVTVNPIPDEYIIPDGMLPITENATYDVRRYARVSASVHPAPNLQDKTVNITENGTQTITADEGYDGLGNVEVNVEIEGAVGKYAPRHIRFTLYPHTEMDYEIQNLDTSNITIMDYMFSTTKLERLDVSHFNTSNVTSMSNTFYGNSNLISLNLGNIDTSKVTNMLQLFTGCTKLTTLDVSHLDTSSCTTIGGMFKQCPITELKVENFNTSKCKNMNDVFSECAVTSLDLSKWNSEIVTSSSGMFYKCTNLTNLDVSGLKFPKSTTLLNFFYDCKNLTSIDVSNFDCSVATSLASMFYNCIGLTEIDLSNWKSTKVTTVHSMFYGCKNLKKLNLSGISGNKISSGIQIFYNCSNLETLIIDNPNLFKITNTNSFTYSGIKSGKCTIYVPDDMVATYQADTYWGKYSSQIKGMSELPTE